MSENEAKLVAALEAVIDARPMGVLSPAEVEAWANARTVLSETKGENPQ